MAYRSYNDCHRSENVMPLIQLTVPEDALTAEGRATVQLAKEQSVDA
jgi:hypothetical protein